MRSIWRETCEIPGRQRLEKEIQADVVVIGAGMAGILIADRLQREGKKVVVLEAGRMAGGQTQNTTAKITSQHGAVYGKMTAQLGEERAALLIRANEEAIAAYRQKIREENIACDLEERDAWIYGDDRELLEQEAALGRKLGAAASFVEEVKLPVEAAGAVRVNGQAQFHPLKFLRAVSESLTVYEHSQVRKVEDCRVETEQGSVEAESIVFACHYPFLRYPGMYAARMYQERSYVLALEKAAQVDGVWLGVGEETCSFRNYGRYLLLGGGGHRAGQNADGGKYALLRAKAKLWFPESREAACWSAQDCMTADGIPYIGPYASGKPNWFVATGFGKWGMTTSMVAAELLTAQICGRDHPYAEIFGPHRVSGAELSGIACNAGEAVKGLGKRLFQTPEGTEAQIAEGSGGIVVVEGQKVGIYRDEKGEVHAVDVRCPHLGCQLEWNPDEKSWDCPCHGSRFDYDGKLLDGPAQEDICCEMGAAALH